MAILNNLWMRGSKKKLGGTVIYNSMGQTIQRELAASVSNPRTESQMSQRVRWANLVSFYRVAKPMMKYAFENKKRTQSDYNALMSANVTASPIALTKQEAAAGACVVAPYTISQGSLPSITIKSADVDWESDIFLGSIGDLNEITVRDFALAVINNNPAINAGDQLSFVRFTQSINEVSGIPYVILRKYEVLMDVANRDLLKNYLPIGLVTSMGGSSDAVLGIVNNGGTGAFALILSRTTGGRTQVSTQQLIMVNMENTLQAYSSEEQIAAAIKSYGEGEDAFLSATSAGYGQQQPIQYTIISAEWDGRVMFPQSYAINAPDFVGKQIAITFNQPLKAAPTEVAIYDWGDDACQQQFTMKGSQVIIPSGKWDEGFTPKGIRSIEVNFDGDRYYLDFQIQQGGLE